MGMYTELNLGLALVKDVPDEIVDILKYMLNDRIELAMELPSHPLFETRRWKYMLRCDSYYFDARTDSSMEFDDIDKKYHLNVRSNLENYDDVFEEFLNFLKPYIDTFGFIGYMRYGEDEDPTLIYHTEQGIEYKYVD